MAFCVPPLISMVRIFFEFFRDELALGFPEFDVLSRIC